MEDDIPFQRALARAFTLCDNYHCSVFGPANPNRLYMSTGWIDPNGTAGGPFIDNTPAFNNVILSWTTYPERLEQAGISWQVYQEEDNYDDNALAWFTQYANVPTSSPLWQRGLLKQPAGAFEYDARHDNLPQVSWIVAPTAQTEHPDYFPAAGAEYVAQKLALAGQPGHPVGHGRLGPVDGSVRGRLQPDAYRPGSQPAFPAALTIAGSRGGQPSAGHLAEPLRADAASPFGVRAPTLKPRRL